MEDLTSNNAKINGMSAFINFIPAYAMWVDADLKIKSINEKFLIFMGKIPSQIEGTSIEDYPFANLKLYFDHLDVLRGRDLSIIDTFEINNEKKVMQFFVNENTVDNSFTVMGIDLSRDRARSEASEESRLYYEEKARSTLIGQLASGVAHEINNPLSIISGFLSQMKRGIEKDPSAIHWDTFSDKISKSKKCVDRIAMIVRGLKFLSKHNYNEPFEKISIREIVAGALDLCVEKFKIGNIDLIVDDPIPLALIECRPFQITQVLINLLINSYDAVEENEVKWTHVSFEEGHDFITVSVTDSGAPIPREIQDKIMQPFFTTKGNKGAGLGLSTSKTLAENNNAKLVFDEKNPHTKFSIIFKKIYDEREKK